MTYITYLRETGRILSTSHTRVIKETEEVGVFEVEKSPVKPWSHFRVKDGVLILVEKAAELEERAQQRDQDRLNRQQEERRKHFHSLLDEGSLESLIEAVRLLGNTLLGEYL